MTESPRAVVREALALARESPPAYTSARGRKDYTAHQSFAVLALKAFLKTDYRGAVQFLRGFAELRDDLGPAKAPGCSTLCYAEQRLLRRGSSPPSRPAPPRPQPSAA